MGKTGGGGGYNSKDWGAIMRKTWGGGGGGVKCERPGVGGAILEKTGGL